jgi:hypothetical protein
MIKNNINHRIKKRNIKYIINIILLLILTIFVIIIYRLNSHDSIFFTNNRINVLLQNGTSNSFQKDQVTYIISYDKHKDSAILFDLPGDLLLSVPYGYDEYPLSSIRPLADIDKKISGPELISRSIETTFHLPIDIYIINTKKVNSDSDFKIIKNIISFPNLFLIKDLNLQLIDKIRLYRLFSKLRQDQLEFHDLFKKGIIEDIIIADGSQRKKVNISKFDEHFQNSFQDIDVRTEDVTLRIINSSGRDMVATNFSKILERLGSNVIFIETGRDIQNSSCIINYYNKNVTTKKIFNLILKSYNCQSNFLENETNQVDIDIILGEEFIL